MVQPVFYKWRNTPRHWTYKWIQIYNTCWFEIWQPSDLTRGLGECPILSYRAIQGVESFSARYACSIDELQSTMFVKGMSIEKLPKYQRCSFFHSGRPHNEIPVWWQVNLPHLNSSQPETKGWVIEENCFVPKLSSLFPLPGGRLNKKDGLTRYGDSHVKDKTS